MHMTVHTTKTTESGIKMTKHLKFFSLLKFKILCLKNIRTLLDCPLGRQNLEAHGRWAHLWEILLNMLNDIVRAILAVCIAGLFKMKKAS